MENNLNLNLEKTGKAILWGKGVSLNAFIQIKKDEKYENNIHIKKL